VGGGTWSTRVSRLLRPAGAEGSLPATEGTCCNWMTCRPAP